MASFFPPVLFYFDIITLVCFLFGGGWVEKNIATMGRKLSFHSVPRYFGALALCKCWEQQWKCFSQKHDLSWSVHSGKEAGKHLMSGHHDTWSNENREDRDLRETLLNLWGSGQVAITVPKRMAPSKQIMGEPLFKTGRLAVNFVVSPVGETAVGETAVVLHSESVHNSEKCWWMLPFRIPLCVHSQF